VLDELLTRIGSRFRRVEPRRRARAFALGLLAELPRKNCWTIAEHAADPSPDGMQHLLARAKWDAGGVRDDARGYVIEHLGDPGAVLVIDETGDVKKGTRHAGRAAAVHRDRRADRERPGRRLPRIRCPARARPHRPRAVPAEVLDR
jgi:SRSO17 transposase